MNKKSAIFVSKETLKIMKKIEKGRGLVKAKNAEDLFRKLGLK